MTSELDEVGIARDLDETRRLLYMVLAKGRTEKYVLAGTLVNALAHHNLGIDADEAMDRVVAAIEDNHLDWIRVTISDITEKLVAGE